MTLAFLSGDAFHRTSFGIKSSKLPVVAPFPVARLSSSSSSALHMAYKLWERLDIEEDEEPNWYLLNCVATNELDLLRQCRTVCDGMEDVVKFVVPIEQLTRSHGASKMVTETKVKYPGYVFAKLRLSPVAYEAIQDLGSTAPIAV
jgi:hypothetical protein